MKTIKLTDGRTVSQSDYVTAKTKDLQEFGYSTLTEQDVLEQVEKIKKGDTDLSVIGLIIEDDIKLF